MQRKNRFASFYCWVIAFACFLLSASSVGMLSYLNALFVTPVSEGLGISRSALSLGSTFSTVTTMLLLPFVGRLYDRFPMRPLVLLGAVLGACAHLCYSFAQNAALFYLGGTLAGLCACLAGAAPITQLLSNWFVEKRGLATGLAFTGSSLVTSLLSPVFSDLIAAQGWRMGYRCISAALLLTALAALALIRPTPESMGLLPHGGKAQSGRDPAAAQGLTQKEALRHPAYWLLALGIFLFGLMTMGTQQQLVSYWLASGAEQSLAVGMYSAVLLSGVVGKLLVGHLYDRLPSPAATALCCTLSACGYGALLLCTRGQWILLPAVLFGLSTAIQVILPSYLTRKFFGARAFLSNVGLITTVLYLGVSVGTPATAFVFDRTSSYRPAWILYALLSLGAMAALLGADRCARTLDSKQEGAA